MAVDRSASVAIPASGGNLWRAWLPALLPLAVACAVFGLVFQHEIVSAVRVWNDSTAYNHCYLVLPMAAFLFWDRRGLIANLRPSPAAWALLLIPPLSALWLAAALADILEAAQLLLMTLVEVVILAVIGPRLFRALLAPLLFLYFLVPFGAFLVPVLQRFTAHFAAAGLEALGIPVFADGFVIQIPEGVFEVAEACAGLRFLIASIVFGCFFAILMYRSKVRRSVLIGLSVATPILANGLRALGLILLAHWLGSGSAMEADHVLYGWLFFSLVTLLLIAVGMTFSERRRGAAVPSTRLIPTASATTSWLKSGAVVAVGLLLAVLGPAWLTIVDSATAAPLGVNSVTLFPRDGWAPLTDAKGDWLPVSRGAGSASLTNYRNGNATVTAFVAAYRLPTRGSPVTRDVTAIADPKVWRILKSGNVSASLAGSAITVNAATLSHNGKIRSVWWFYIVEDQVTESTFKAKLLQARAGLSRSEGLGKFIAISAADGDGALDNPVLATFLKSLAPLDSSSERAIDVHRRT